MGSVKSAFIKDNKLEDYTLNANRIRLMCNFFKMTIKYRKMISKFNNKVLIK